MLFFISTQFKLSCIYRNLFILLINSQLMTKKTAVNPVLGTIYLTQFV
jgi:hypothetical protein